MSFVRGVHGWFRGDGGNDSCTADRGWPKTCTLMIKHDLSRWVAIAYLLLLLLPPPSPPRMWRGFRSSSSPILSISTSTMCSWSNSFFAGPLFSDFFPFLHPFCAEFDTEYFFMVASEGSLAVVTVKWERSGPPLLGEKNGTWGPL